jgi:thymidine phosphorylase
LEVEEAVAILRGANHANVIELVLRLGELMLMMTGRFKSGAVARALLRAKLRSGAAFERFKAMVRLQGGAANRIDKKICGPAKCAYYQAPAAGYVQALDAGLIGRSALLLGAGRTKLGDKIDRSAGILCVKKIGDRVERAEPLTLMFAQSKEQLAEARKLVAEAYRIGKKYVKPPRLIVEEI